MTLEPISGSLIITKAAFDAGTAAIQLSDTVIGRMKLRRAIAQAEEQELRRWLQEQLARLRWEGQARLTTAALAAITRIWEDCQLATARNPGAEHYFVELRERMITKILREAGGF